MQTCLDVCSLYPTVMIGENEHILGFECMYPIGLPTYTNEFIEGKIGFYEVEVHYQLPNIKNVIPRRYYKSQKMNGDLKYVEFDNEKQLDWKYKGSFTTFLNSNDILVLRKYHGDACCTVKNGLYFTQSVKG